MYTQYLENESMQFLLGCSPQWVATAMSEMKCFHSNRFCVCISDYEAAVPESVRAWAFSLNSSFCVSI